MNQISAETQLAMPRAEAWAKLRDLTLAQYCVPGVLRIEITTARREGVGASRRAHCKGCPPVDETVILWEDEPPFGILGRLINALLLRRLFPATLNSIARGLRQVDETGASANPLVEGLPARSGTIARKPGSTTRLSWAQAPRRRVAAAPQQRQAPVLSTRSLLAVRLRFLRSEQAVLHSQAVTSFDLMPVVLSFPDK
jgi:hypothetical protein